MGINGATDTVVHGSESDKHASRGDESGMEGAVDRKI